MPIPRHEAITIVNDNAERITGTLRASGSVSGHVTVDDRKRSFDVSGTLFFLKPRFVRFDLKSIAGTEFLVGSNTEHYWVFSKPGGEHYICRPHDPDRDPAAEGIALRPDQIVNALGLLPITPPKGEHLIWPPVQRVVDEHQQLLFVQRDPLRGLILEKEYWLSGFDDRLVRRVIFRDAEGLVEMISDLSEYAPLDDDGDAALEGRPPLLPGRIEARWPKDGAAIRFNIRKWQLYEQLGPDSPQFVPPHELGIRYEHEDIQE